MNAPISAQSLATPATAGLTRLRGHRSYQNTRQVRQPPSQKKRMFSGCV